MGSNSGAYQIRSLKTGKRYVGATCNLRNRWSKHKSDLRKGRHGNRLLQAAWEADGADSFEFDVLEYAEGRELLLEIEQKYIDQFHPEYNIAPYAGTCLGIKQTEETRRRKGMAATGERNAWYGKTLPCAGASRKAEVREKISTANSGTGNPMFGVTPSHAKLADSDVRAIRAALAEGAKSQTLADKYGVSKAAIQNIKKGRTYLRVS
ncbi:GIY-YIG nuclease family protein [Pseudomonas aeruginosa]|uniref:GIY-YIG nuclease family protein n=1 Tax=Pseudomonas aeruginosa group TaxID=136841 RepID=UPI0008FBB3BA|nr:GIY-YIG nuclease family protein [Pseudomonas aeruginosa]EKL0657317.1 GIY-YIG nuclease family protein [Pseudomonas aeruginosa]EKU4549224.1 GIY-YIG nuclease family protein [Pseudomonas aeruginosa]EKV6736647.1 GIY-YIG nuclease family protein [Pseudomonas aeruginosa]EKV6879980.1 GIY-YIG nuclease family protein [Pseudomonas aeruginosa]EKX0392432.1 GIY-YIG nuclease family protein [Pseudomonas aeruginosa]